MQGWLPGRRAGGALWAEASKQRGGVGAGLFPTRREGWVGFGLSSGPMSTAEQITWGMTAVERRIVGFTSVAHGLNHAVELVYGAVLFVIAIEFDVRLALLGAIANASALAYAVMALPAGQAADRLGSKRMVSISMGGAGAAALLAAASPNTTVLAVALVIMGLLGGLYHPAGLSLITRGVRQRARALGIHGAGGNVGTALAPLIAGALAGIWSWRASFLFFAIVAITVAAVTYRSQVEEPDRDARASTKPPRPTLLFPLALMFVVNAGFGFIFRGLTTFLPLHLSTNLGFGIAGFEPVVVGGAFATFALLFGVVGQYLGGELGERFRRHRLLLPIAALTIPALLAMAFSTGWVLLAAAAVFVFFNFMAQPTAVAMISDFATERIHGRIYGLTSLTGFGIGSFGGLIADSAGVEWVFVMLAGASVLITLTAAAVFSWQEFRASAQP
jgi:FSR family fosmidomycin resistance protein-like MFS transporter